MVIWNSYVARKHQDAEYKYQGVFVAIIDQKARRRDLNNIYTLLTFIAYLDSYYLVSLDLFSIHLRAPAYYIRLSLQYYYPHNTTLGAWFGCFLRLALPSRQCRYLVVVLLAGHSIFSSLPEFAQVFFLLCLEPSASSECTSLPLDSARRFLSSILSGDESRSWRTMGLTYVPLLWNYSRRIWLMVTIDTNRFGRS